MSSNTGSLADQAGAMLLPQSPLAAKLPPIDKRIRNPPDTYPGNCRTGFDSEKGIEPEPRVGASSESRPDTVVRGLNTIRESLRTAPFSPARISLIALTGPSQRSSRAYFRIARHAELNLRTASPRVQLPTTWNRPSRSKLSAVNVTVNAHSRRRDDGSRVVGQPELGQVIAFTAITPLRLDRNRQPAAQRSSGTADNDMCYCRIRPGIADSTFGRRHEDRTTRNRELPRHP